MGVTIADCLLLFLIVGTTVWVRRMWDREKVIIELLEKHAKDIGELRSLSKKECKDVGIEP